MRGEQAGDLVNGLGSGIAGLPFRPKLQQISAEIRNGGVKRVSSGLKGRQKIIRGPIQLHSVVPANVTQGFHLSQMAEEIITFGPVQFGWTNAIVPG